MGVIKATFLTHPGVRRSTAVPNVEVGATITTVLALASLVPLLIHHKANPIFLMLAAFCLLITLWVPQVFTLTTQGWQAITLALSKFFITLFWVFYILPAGLIMQARGGDPLHLRFQPQAKTYWQPPTPRNDMQRLS